jgi:hypothetical protein
MFVDLSNVQQTGGAICNVLSECPELLYSTGESAQVTCDKFRRLSECLMALCQFFQSFVNRHPLFLQLLTG